MSVPYASLRKSRRVFWIPVLLLVFTACASSAFGTATIRILHGANQETTYGSSFPSALVVLVTDSALERGVAGIRVNFISAAGVGLSSSYAVTNEYGLASVTATGLAACNSEVSAQISGIPGTRVTFEGLIVNKAPLMVVPGDLKSVAGSAIPAASSYSFKGFVNGDTPNTAQITGTPVLSTTATDHSPHANYAIKGGVGSLFAPNYSFVAGFGTLAILDEKNPDEENPDGQYSASRQQDTFAVPSANENGVRVRAALVGPLQSLTMVQPNFIAGLRGESGVFVRAAIWQNAASNVYLQSLQSHDANENMPVAMATNLPTLVVNVRSNADAPVRSVILPHLVTASAAINATSTRSAIPAVVVDSRKNSGVPVRAAITPKSSTAQYSYTGSSIRTAFNPPGGK
jgi:hypothetical protein